MAKGKRFTLEDMQFIANERGGRCLSSIYINSKTKLEWECSNGHTWLAAPSHIVSGTWCRSCHFQHRRLSISDMQILAEKKGGKCLSDKYINANSKLKWICSDGHIWETKPSVIQRGYWCPDCAGLTKKTLKEMQSLAENRGGKCLSIEYINIDSKLEWECVKGHIWEQTPKNIKNGSWCPICNSFYYTEEKCRYILQSIFNNPFRRTRQPLEGLELDGFNKELKLAFEYQGVQHYEYVQYFHGTEENFKKRVHMDNLKAKLCKEKEIKLLVIPYYKVGSDEELFSYIVEQLLQINVLYDIPKFIDFDEFYKAFSIVDQLDEIAKNRGGKLISKEYSNDNKSLKWECSEGHQWFATPKSIKKGTWCRKCVGLEKLNLNIFREIAKSRNGKCLSNEYRGVKSELVFQCSKGHIWSTKAANIRKGNWCKICAGKSKKTIEEMQEIAKSKGGLCLSSNYINYNTKLKWRCREGHIWMASPRSIINHWCSECYKLRRGSKTRLSIESMQHLASEKNGLCLSKEYKNAHTKLQWQCIEGHVWTTTPHTIKKGSWCPKCSKNK